MDFLVQMAIYPAITMLLVGLLFMHLSLRSRASFASFLSLFLLVAWSSLAHWAVHAYIDMTTKPGTLTPFERIGAYSAHPNFDTINDLVSAALLVIFCVSFFLSAIAVPSSNTNQTQLPLSRTGAVQSASTKSLWALAAIALALSLSCAVWYQQIAWGYGSPADAVIPAGIALVCLPACFLFVAIALRRKISLSSRA